MNPSAADRSAPLAALEREMKGCVACDLSVGRTQVVPGEGNPASPVVFVGHGPGGTDDATGRPYTGPGGELLDQLLAQAGIRREEVFLTNLTRCWAWKEEFGRRVNRAPAAREIKACVPRWLAPELALLRPKVIVCLGGPTAQHFLGRDFKITQSRGEWLAMPETSPYLKLLHERPDPLPAVMAVLQPAYLIHLEEHAPESSPGARQGMLRDLARVKAVLDGADPRGGRPEAVELELDDELPF